MKSFDDIKNMWQQQAVQPQKDAAEIMAKARRTQSGMNRRMIIEGLSLFATFIILVLVMVMNDFDMATTYTGLILMILCILAFACIRIWQYRWLRSIDLSGEPRQVLSQLEKYYEVQKKVNTKCILIYASVLNILFAFYFIEILKPFSITGKIITLVIYSIWMMIAIFVIGARSAKKEDARMQAIINTIKGREQALEEL